ncbi:MAG: class I SAM-dependent methyltransferase [Nitrospinales bacterium]
MPTSTFSQINSFVTYLQQANPNSLLDIGVGNGKLGFIARDLLDVMLGERFRKRDWKITIDGIEVFPDYIQDHQKAIYDEIHIGDAFDVIDTLGAYDLIVVGDVLEHFEKTRALKFLDKCVAHCNKHVIISIPLGENWTQPAVYGNPYEEHLSFWRKEEFEPFADQKNYVTFPGIGLYGTYLINKEDYILSKAWEQFDGLCAAGRQEEAFLLMETVLWELPASPKNDFSRAEFFLKQNKIEQAVNQLNQVKEKFPEYAPVAADYINKLSGLLADKTFEAYARKVNGSPLLPDPRL